jgi:hypothetical protein
LKVHTQSVKCLFKAQVIIHLPHFWEVFPGTALSPPL